MEITLRRCEIKHGELPTDFAERYPILSRHWPGLPQPVETGLADHERPVIGEIAA